MTTNDIPALPRADSTSNALIDFDLALAISQQAINNQLMRAWCRWHGQPGSACRLHTELPGANGAAPAVFDAVIDAPQLSLLVPGGGPTDVLVTLPIASGSLAWQDGGAPAASDLGGWRLHLRTSLARRPLTLDALGAVDASSAARAGEAIAALPEGTFSIECLFLDLTAVAAIGAADIEAGGAPVTPALAQQLGACVARLLGAQPFLLGTVVYPHRMDCRPSFTLKDYLMKVTPNPQAVQASTVDYLGVFWDGLALPPNPQAAAAALGPWLDAGRIDGSAALVGGVMAVRGRKVSDAIVASLRQTLDSAYRAMDDANNARRRNGVPIANPAVDLPHPEAELIKQMTVDSDGRRISLRHNPGCNHYAWADGDISFVLDKTLQMDFLPQHGGGYAVSGSLSAHLVRNRKVNLNFESDAWANVQVTFTGAMGFEARARDMGCQVVPVLYPLSFSQAQKTSGGNSNWFRETILRINNQWDQDQSLNFANDASAAVQQMFTAVASQLTLALDKLAFIPPGEDVFTFQAPRFTRAADLLLDVIYKAPLKQPAA